MRGSEAVLDRDLVLWAGLEVDLRLAVRTGLGGSSGAAGSLTAFTVLLECRKRWATHRLPGRLLGPVASAWHRNLSTTARLGQGHVRDSNSCARSRIACPTPVGRAPPSQPSYDIGMLHGPLGVVLKNGLRAQSQFHDRTESRQSLCRSRSMRVGDPPLLHPPMGGPRPSTA